MNMTGMMQAMQNPQAAMMQYAAQGMISQHPNEWKKAQEMFSNKNREQQISALQELYKEKGMDLNSVASQWGIRL